MEVTSVKAELNETGEGKHVAVVTVVFDEVLKIKDLRLVPGNEGDLRLYFPSRKNRVSDSWYNIVELNNRELWQGLKEMAVEEYNKIKGV